MGSSREWMYERWLPNGGGLNDVFVEGIKHFVTYAVHQHYYKDGEKIRCPCVKCKNLKFKMPDDVLLHLVKWGFTPRYHVWTAHGEDDLDGNVPHQHNYGSSFTQPRQGNFVVDADLQNNQETNTNTYMNMVYENAEPNVFVQPPNPEAQKFFDLMEAATQPLWDGCETRTVLASVCHYLNIKAENNISEEGFNGMIAETRRGHPQGHHLPENFYRFKQMLKPLGLGYEKIDVCRNGCTLFYKDRSDLEVCPRCKEPRFKQQNAAQMKRKRVALKHLRYFPLTPRLKRLYLSTATASHMTWHKIHIQENGKICHPSDSASWKHFDLMYPDFASESRNVRLGLCSDGFSPFGPNATPYSCWPVIITPYNLPPWMCMKDKFMFLTLLIPGPRSPGKYIDVFLEPLMDELKSLWSEGTTCYDVSTKENFNMKAALMWTINDFPAYGMLSGWSTHGRLSCPYCMENSKAFRLPASRKNCFFDCHRQFLPMGSQMRRDRKNFVKGHVENSFPPPRLDGETLWDRVKNYPQISEISTKQLPGFGTYHNWTKKSIFWELPYWRTHLVRHNLDVMHIEKNIFDNVFNTVMAVKGKTKDNVNARIDLQEFCDRPEFCGDHALRLGVYSLSTDQTITLLKWVSELKVPDGYLSNLARCVDLTSMKMSHVKSHDCHVFMEVCLQLLYES